MSLKLKDETDRTYRALHIMSRFLTAVVLEVEGFQTPTWLRSGSLDVVVDMIEQICEKTGYFIGLCFPMWIFAVNVALRSICERHDSVSKRLK